MDKIIDPLHITDRVRLLEMMARRRNGASREIDELAMNDALKKRIRGQDHIVNHLCSHIRRQYGKEHRDKPVANLFFVGPPATGKTELAKALAEYLFEDEKNMLRFDCSELSGAEGKTRLIGTPTGYVGANDGGQLTRPMLSNSERLILFDEIEKAYSGVFDLFLSLMGEGRLTEQGSNKVADFTRSVIVLTSNAQHDAITKLATEIDDASELTKAAKSVLSDSKTFRPELLSRFDHVYVFKPLSGVVNAEIAALKIAKAAKEYGVEITFIEPELVYEIMDKGDAAKDTRELTRIVDATLGELLIQARSKGLRQVRVGRDGDGNAFVQPELEAHTDGPRTA